MRPSLCLYHILRISPQYAFELENEAIFKEWDDFLEEQVKRAKEVASKKDNLEKARVGPTLHFPRLLRRLPS